MNREEIKGNIEVKKAIIKQLNEKLIRVENEKKHITKRLAEFENRLKERVGDDD